MKIHIKKLTEPTLDIAAAFNKWENDPTLVHLIHPNQNEEALQRRKTVTVNELAERIKHSRVYLIYVQGELIGTIDYQVDEGFDRFGGCGFLSHDVVLNQLGALTLQRFAGEPLSGRSGESLVKRFRPPGYLR